MKRTRKGSYLITLIFIVVSVFLIVAVQNYDFNKEYRSVKVAYITRSKEGNSYNDIYNEEIIKLFSRVNQVKAEVVKGSYDELKDLKDIDIFIDYHVPSKTDEKIKLLTKMRYIIYTKDENFLPKGSKVAILKNNAIFFQELAVNNHMLPVIVKDIEEGFEKIESGEVKALLSLDDPIYMKNPKREEYKRREIKGVHDYDKTMFIMSSKQEIEDWVKRFSKNFKGNSRALLEERVKSKLIWSQIELTEEEEEYIKNKRFISIGGNFERMAPYAFMKGKEVKGNISEYMKLLQDGTGLRIIYVPLNGEKSMKSAVHNKEIDIIAGYVPSKKDDDMAVTPPYFETLAGIYGLEGRADDHIEDILKEFDGEKSITGIKLDRENNTYKAFSGEGVTVLYKMLNNGDIDYFIHSYSILKNSNNLNGIKNIRLYGLLENKVDVSMAAAVENTIAINILTKLFHYLDHNKITYKWELESSTITKKNTYKHFVYILGVALLFLLPYILILRIEMKKIKKIERELQETKNNLEAALNIKSAFLANMSHEMRTPLTAILGFNKLLLRKEEDAKKMELLKNVEVAGETLLNFINNVLDLSKLESGKIELKYKRINLFQMTDELERISLGLKRSDDVEFCFIITEDAPRYFMGDEVWLKEIILNLLGNAFKFTEKGSVQLIIAKEVENLIVEVKDTGIGMPNLDKETDKIFRRYEQLDLNENRDKKGSGLGLAIVKEVVELMEGKITVKSIYKKGTTFRIVLPIKKKLEITGAVRGGSVKGRLVNGNEGV